VGTLGFVGVRTKVDLGFFGTKGGPWVFDRLEFLYR